VVNIAGNLHLTDEEDAIIWRFDAKGFILLAPYMPLLTLEGLH
jgi:hypothetical protein